MGQDGILRAVANRARSAPIGNRPQVGNLPHIAMLSNYWDTLALVPPREKVLSKRIYNQLYFPY